MANETEFSNFITVAAFVEANVQPHFRSAAIMPNLMHTVQIPRGSNASKLRKAGSLTATAKTESTDQANAEYTESSPNTLTLAAVKVYVELSDEAVRHGNADINALAREAGLAVAQKFDTDAMALFDAFNGGTAVGTSGVDCSPQVLLQANYTLQAQNIPGPYVYVLQPVQIYDVQDDILAASASLWANPAMLDIMGGQAPSDNGLRGSFLGNAVYQSTNVESVNTNADWAGAHFSPQYGLAAGFETGGQLLVEFDKNIKKGVYEMAVTLWYDVKEYSDVAGVSIETDQ